LAANRFQARGTQLIKNAAGPELVALLREDADRINAKGPGARISALTPAMRTLIIGSSGLAETASQLEGEKLIPVRALIFYKTAESNWAVAWHQDRVIALTERHVLPGFERWTTKSGTPHVEPPENLSRRMITIRLHLDACGEENAPLKVIKGSHLLGRLDEVSLQKLVSTGAKHCFTADSGDALAVKTLVVHASERAQLIAQRRVLHVDFAPDCLPDTLSWALDINSGNSQ
jgi:hypothetical protein